MLLNIWKLGNLYIFLTYLCFKLLHNSLVEHSTVFLGILETFSSLVISNKPLMTSQNTWINAKVELQINGDLKALSYKYTNPYFNVLY